MSDLNEMSGTRNSLITETLVRDVLGSGAGRAVLRVSSSSMRPRLNEGDEVAIEPVSHRRLVPGDVVVFGTEGAGLVVHRLIWRDHPLGRPTRIFTKGDALGYLDQATTPDRILGRVVSIRRGDGHSRPTTLSDRVRCLGQAAGYATRRWIRRHLGRLENR